MRRSSTSKAATAASLVASSATVSASRLASSAQVHAGKQQDLQCNTHLLLIQPVPQIKGVRCFEACCFEL